MKNVNYAFVWVAGVTLLAACHSNLADNQVPAAIKNSFEKQFPGVSAKWEKEEGKYEAGFKLDGIEKTVVFNMDGTIEESESAIPVGELPQAVTDSINSRYHTPVIKEAAKIVLSNGEVQYEAVFGGMDHIFDTNGNLLKKSND